MRRDLKEFRIVVVISTIIFGSLGQAFAQNAQLAQHLRKQYDNCVFDAVGSQWKDQPRILPSLAAENAFVACATEEQAMLAVTNPTNALQLQQAQTVITAVKMQLKRTVREIMSDPKGYMQRNSR
jgi:hypothetical protein